MNQNCLTLYPSNWLYNAGVLGLLKVLKNSDEPIEAWLNDDGTVKLPMTIFDPIRIENMEIPKSIKAYVDYIVDEEEVQEWLVKEDKKKISNKEKFASFKEEMGNFGYKFIRASGKLFGSKTPYQNLVQPSEWRSLEFSNLLLDIPNINKKDSDLKCDLCKNMPIVTTNAESNLEKRLVKLQSTHLPGIGPSMGEFPNGFWNLNQSVKICIFCAYLIMHHHLSLTRLTGSNNIFINVPSFKIMYHLNKFIEKTFGLSFKDDVAKKRDILAMSVIEYSTKLKATLGTWTGMNLEIISKGKDYIDFFSLPYETLRLISDRHIASVLSDIGEFKILNLVLNQEYSKLVENGYRLLRESLLDIEKQNKKLIDDWLFSYKNKGYNLHNTANKILKLYTLIEQKIKRSSRYGSSEIAISSRATF